jgi:hypothetical protein
MIQKKIGTVKWLLLLLKREAVVAKIWTVKWLLLLLKREAVMGKIVRLQGEDMVGKRNNRMYIVSAH